MSLGGPLPSFALHDAIEDATNAGLILVAAAGNQWPFVVFPARYDEVIAVAASNCADQRWVSSASGSDVDITAPGESVWRAETKSTGTFDVSRSSGTSYAAAQVAGAAALWLAHHGRSTLVGRYGAANVPAVFKELLTTQGFRCLRAAPGTRTISVSASSMRRRCCKLRCRLRRTPPACACAVRPARFR